MQQHVLASPQVGFPAQSLFCEHVLASSPEPVLGLELEELPPPLLLLLLLLLPFVPDEVPEPGELPPLEPGVPKFDEEPEPPQATINAATAKLPHIARPVELFMV